MRRFGSISLGAAAVAAALLLPGAAFGQTTPLGGAITLSLTPSSIAPPISTTFTVDLTINLSAATGTCGGSVPMSLGAYDLGVTFDNTKLSFTGSAACPTAPAQFSGAPSCNNTGTEVLCNGVNSGNTNQPQGSVCVLRLTFTNIGATPGTPAALATTHTPLPRSIGSQAITSPSSCGPAAPFPSGSITDGSVPVITPATLVLFAAE